MYWYVVQNTNAQSRPAPSPQKHAKGHGLIIYHVDVCVCVCPLFIEIKQMLITLKNENMRKPRVPVELQLYDHKRTLLS